MTTKDYIIAKIKGFHIANMTLKKWKLNYDRVKREFWQTLGALAVVILALFLVFGGDNGDTVIEDEYIAVKTQADAITGDDFITTAIKMYCECTGRKVYPSGEHYIREAARRENLTTVNDILILIHANEATMWKNLPPSVSMPLIKE